jgi:hypothetical protein
MRFIHLIYFWNSQHWFCFSVSLKNGKGLATLGAPKAHRQHLTFATQLGFSHTNSRFGLGQLSL